MSKYKNVKILTHTKYIAWVFDNVLHSTKNPCEDVYKIPPDERWYLDDKPTKNFRFCEKCFVKNEKF